MKCNECNEEINPRTSHIMLREWQDLYPMMTDSYYHTRCYNETYKVKNTGKHAPQIPEATPLPQGVEKEESDTHYYRGKFGINTAPSLVDKIITGTATLTDLQKAEPVAPSRIGELDMPIIGITGQEQKWWDLAVVFTKKINELVKAVNKLVG